MMLVMVVVAALMPRGYYAKHARHAPGDQRGDRGRLTRGATIPDRTRPALVSHLHTKRIGKPQLVKVIEPEGSLRAPVTRLRVPLRSDGIYINALGAPDVTGPAASGDGPEAFEIQGRWEKRPAFPA